MVILLPSLVLLYTSKAESIIIMIALTKIPIARVNKIIEALPVNCTILLIIRRPKIVDTNAINVIQMAQSYHMISLIM